jgi:hypothetical protein
MSIVLSDLVHSVAAAAFGLLQLQPPLLCEFQKYKFHVPLLAASLIQAHGGSSYSSLYFIYTVYVQDSA